MSNRRGESEAGNKPTFSITHTIGRKTNRVIGFSGYIEVPDDEDMLAWVKELKRRIEGSVRE